MKKLGNVILVVSPPVFSVILPPGVWETSLPTLTTGLRAVATKLISPEFDELAKDEEVMGGRVDPLFNSTVSTVTKRGKVTLVSVSVDNSETSPDGTDDRLPSTLGALVIESLSNNCGSVNLVAVVVLFAVVIWFVVTVVAMVVVVLMLVEGARVSVFVVSVVVFEKRNCGSVNLVSWTISLSVVFWIDPPILALSVVVLPDRLEEEVVAEAPPSVRVLSLDPSGADIFIEFGAAFVRVVLRKPGIVWIDETAVVVVVVRKPNIVGKGLNITVVVLLGSLVESDANNMSWVVSCGVEVLNPKIVSPGLSVIAEEEKVVAGLVVSGA